MRTVICAALTLFCVVPVEARAAETYAFVGARVITMTSPEILEKRTVIVSDGVIESTSPDAAARVPDSAVRIDAAGRFLMPGLAEMHAHVPVPSRDPEYLDRVLQLFVANGVTLVRGMLGHPEHLQLRAELEQNRRIGPALVTSGPSLNGRSVTAPDQGVRMARQQKEAGYDFLKLHPGLALDAFESIAEQANALAMPFAGHVSVAVGLERTLRSGQASIDHLDGYMSVLVPEERLPSPSEWGFFGFSIAPLASNERVDEWARRTALDGVWNVPTQALMVNWAGPEAAEELLQRPAMRYVSRSLRAQYTERKNGILGAGGYSANHAQKFLDVRAALIGALHRAGAGLLLGSDAPQVFNVPGFSAHQELGLLVAAGLDPYDALATGTSNPARFFGREGDFGVVAKGARADLVLLNRNPLADIDNTRSIEGVMVRGRWLDRAALDAMLAALEYD